MTSCVGASVDGRLGGRVVLDALPPVLTDLAERWQIEFDSLIQGGSTFVVIRCRTANDRPAVLKVCFDRRRVSDEAAALRSWRTVHVPAVLDVDEKVGALLIEAIEPGTPLAESPAFPDVERENRIVLHTPSSAANA
jgi:streptomycin 6-kinase